MTQAPTPAGTAYLDMTDVLRYLEHQSAVSGIQRVVVEVAPRLAQSLTCEYVSYCPPRGCYVRLQTQAVEALIEAVTHASESTKAVVNTIAKELLDSLETAPVLRGGEGDVLGILGSAWGQAGLFKDVQRLKSEGASAVILLFDIIPVLLPGFPEGAVHEFRHYVPRVALLADRAPTISDSTRRDFDRYCHTRGWETPPGETTKLAADQWDAERLAKMGLSADPGWDRPYALFVSTIEVRKNHILALRAWRRLIERLGPDAVPDLVLVGRLGWSVLEFLEEFESTDGLNGKIHILDSVSESRLAALYRDCMFTVYPSLYEGWGLPVAESLQWGRPVVCARNSSLEEVGLDLVRYFENDDVDSMTEAVEAYITDPESLAADADRIREHYRPPSWQDVSEVLRGEFEAALTARRPVPLQTVLGREYGVVPLRPFNEAPFGEVIARFVERERRLPLTGQGTSIAHFLQAELLVASRYGRTRIDVVRPSSGELFLVGCTPDGFGHYDVQLSGPAGLRQERLAKGGAFIIGLGAGSQGSLATAEVAAIGGGRDFSPLRSFVVLADRAEAEDLVAQTLARLARERKTKVKRRVAATGPGKVAAAGVRRVRARQR